ncbi:MAG: hypothetical protein NXI20_13315 [bacterium]|nr:hypothetical protein [bacterium]
MIAFYALGGGFGHLTRVRTFINQLNVADPFKIITTNKYAYSLFEESEVILIELYDPSSSSELAIKIDQILISHNFKACYIDTFFNGILSELNGEILKGIELNLICRRLKWDSYYSENLENLHFKKAFILEELEATHLQFVTQHSEELININLVYPIASDSIRVGEPYWLIIHSTQKEELEILINHARSLPEFEDNKPKLIVCSDQTPSNETVEIINDPLPYLEGATKIFSGAGFNTWYQLRPYRNKHICIPFKRRFDDQFWRSTQV